MRYKLLSRLVPAANIVVDKIYEANGMRPMPELEIDPMTARLTLDVDALLGGVVLQNQLLQEKEGTLVVHTLADLHLRLPQMRRVHTLAVIAL